ncbi:cupin domain-containing protein [Streptomyces tremellae]|uniref:Cupin type-2 domain-containing protein n=1 Tax=Streptomyces tremellae TaxID=1124239 RepID=A0ABP7G5F2_9ACTN
MTFTIPVPDRDDPRWTRRGAVLVRSFEGIPRWGVGDTYTIKLTAGQTGGSLGFIEASVPPGGGPDAHAHGDEDETFYLLDGELEFLNGDETFTARTGDLVFVPRGNRHRFKNTGDRTARMVFLFTPGGFEDFFVTAGDEPRPGEEAPVWGPERYEAIVSGFEKYHVTQLPEDK